LEGKLRVGSEKKSAGNPEEVEGGVLRSFFVSPSSFDIDAFLLPECAAPLPPSISSFRLALAVALSNSS
jgi:hypothetical protein